MLPKERFALSEPLTSPLLEIRMLSRLLPSCRLIHAVFDGFNDLEDVAEIAQISPHHFGGVCHSRCHCTMRRVTTTTFSTIERLIVSIDLRLSFSQRTPNLYHYPFPLCSGAGTHQADLEVPVPPLPLTAARCGTRRPEMR